MAMIRNNQLMAVVSLGCFAAVLLSLHRHRSHSVLIAAPDVPGFKEEAEFQSASGTHFDDVGYWETPGNFNNRALSDLFQSQMDARMTNDATNSGWYDTGAADFGEPSSMVLEPGEDSELRVDNSYDNAWPGTGSGFYSFDDLAANTDNYDGQWDVTSQDAEAADNAAVSGLKGRQQMLEENSCIQCLGGENCVAGCRMIVSHGKGRANKGAAKHIISAKTKVATATSQHSKESVWLRKAIMNLPIVNDIETLTKQVQSYRPRASKISADSKSDSTAAKATIADADIVPSPKNAAKKYGIGQQKFQDVSNIGTDNAITSPPRGLNNLQMSVIEEGAMSGSLGQSAVESAATTAAGAHTLQMQTGAESSPGPRGAKTNLDGYFPIDGHKEPLTDAGVLVDSGEGMPPNLSLRGYFPVDGGDVALQRAGVRLGGPLPQGFEHDMPEQPQGVWNFFDSGKKLKKLGVHVA